MKIFITATFKGIYNKGEVEQLCGLVDQSGFESFCFVRDVEHYQFGSFPTPKDLMDSAKLHISQCNALLFQASETPSTGRAIEAGIAFQLGLPIVVIKPRSVKIKDTLIGVASEVIEYDHIDDIVLPLKEFYSKITNSI